ncbi:MAG: glycosyltransferase [Nitrospirae bacterium]|nr:glycosyltransferase [Nitrospirota bacterium]
MNIAVISQMFPCKRHPISAVFFANLMRELAPKVNELIIITPRPYIPRSFAKINKGWQKWFLDPEVTKENGMEIIRPHVLLLPGVRFEGINGILIQLSLISLLHKLIRKRRIDVILGYNMLPEGIASVRLANMFKLPAVFWAIGDDVNIFANHNEINRYLSKKCIEKSSIVLTESKDLEDKIIALGANRGRVETFYKGIDVSQFKSLPSKDVMIRNLKLNPARRHLLFVGRLTREKGIYELIHAFTSISKRYPDMDLLLIGEEMEKVQVMDILRHHGITKRVILKGIIPYNEIPKYMKASDFMALPTWAEGLPNVVMEAMASSLPVVATDVGGIPEVLKHRVTGLSVPPKNIEKLKDALIEMIEDKQLRETCVRNAKELIEDKFDVRKNVDQLYKMLEQIRN